MKLEHLSVIKISGIISTDDIIPAHHKHKSTDPAVLAKHVFENRFPGLSQSIVKNTVLISDATFGIGSSREQAVSSLLAAGVVAVLAPNFGRIFFRNSWNLGLVAIEVAPEHFNDTTSLSIDLPQNTIHLNNTAVPFGAIPKELIHMLHAGGLLPYVKSHISSIYHSTQETPHDY